MVKLAAAFIESFAAYELGRFGFALVVGGTDTFTFSIVGRILIDDACWLAALVAIHVVLTRAAPRVFGPPLSLSVA